MLPRTLLEKILIHFKKRILLRSSQGIKYDGAFPAMVYLELTNHCNLRCIMCTFHSPFSPFNINGHPPRKKGFMKRSLAFSIIDELGSSGKPICIALHGAGEPLLHKDLPFIVYHASRYSNLDVGFLTNGMLLTKEKSIELIGADLRWISFSIDGISPSLFNTYRRGAVYEQVYGNVMTFLDLSEKTQKKIKTHVNMTLQREMAGEVNDFVEFWLTKVNRVSVSPSRPMGSRKSLLVPPGITRIPCFMLNHMMVIYWNGDVGLCCEDWFNDGRMGNVKENGIRSVWNGARFEWAREMHKKGLYSKVPLCGDCDIWFNNTPEVIRDEEKGYVITKNAWQWEYVKYAL